MTRSTGCRGLMRSGSPPIDSSASRMEARSTTAGTPVKSCRRTRAGANATSRSSPALGRQFASASMSSRETASPSSRRSRFSRSTRWVKGRRVAASPLRTESRRWKATVRPPTVSVSRLLKLSSMRSRPRLFPSHDLSPGARRARVRRLRDEARAVYRERGSRTPGGGLTGGDAGLYCGSGPVAQRLERPAHNRLVGGSNPPGPTTSPDLTVDSTGAARATSSACRGVAGRPRASRWCSDGGGAALWPTRPPMTLMAGRPTSSPGSGQLSRGSAKCGLARETPADR